MTASQTTTSKRAAATAVGRLFVLNLGGGQVLSMNPDGTGKTVLAAGAPFPDGIVVDVEAGHIYWTNMGVPSQNDGYIERADLDGGNRKTIVPPGVTFTPKQLHLEKDSGKLYWSDREGMRVMRANLDGSAVETLVQTGESDADRRDVIRWCVGIAVDPGQGHIYWTQKGPDNAGVGRLLRAGIDIPKRCCTTDCPSRSTSSWISRTVSSTGPTAATHRGATRSTARPWTRAATGVRSPKSFSLT